MRTVILHLGGNLARLDTTIRVALACPDARVVISSESNPAEVIRRLDAAGISRARYVLDYRAWDTVSNFTATRDLWEGAGAPVVTSDIWHLFPRVLAIVTALRIRWTWEADIFADCLLPATETRWRIRLDILRAHVWRLTGWLPSNPFYKRRMLRLMRGYERDAERLLALPVGAA